MTKTPEAKTLTEQLLDEAITSLNATPVDTGDPKLKLWKIEGSTGSWSAPDLVVEALRRVGAKL